MSGRTMRYSLQCVILLVTVLLVACAGTRGTGDGPDRTGGISIELFIEWADHSAAYYHVMTDGTIGYGGAQDARRRHVSWTGTLSDEQIEELRDILHRHNLLTDQPTLTDDVDDPTYRITIRSHEGRNRIRASGANPSVEELYEHLREIAKQRFDRILDTLPQPERP